MLSDKEIEKRMIDALEEGGRRTIDDLAKSTGFDKERIGKALTALETEEIVAHITLEGVPRFYACAAYLKAEEEKKVGKEKKVRKVPDKVPCPKCGHRFPITGYCPIIKEYAPLVCTCGKFTIMRFKK